MSATAFVPALAPLPFRATAPLPRRPLQRPWRSSRRPLMCAELHESWKIYEMPGNQCVLCQGAGTTKCLYCFGEGTVTIGPEAARDTITCPHCNGTGREECVRCEGTGIRPDDSFDVLLMEWEDNLTNEQVRNQKKDAQEEDDFVVSQVATGL